MFVYKMKMNAVGLKSRVCVIAFIVIAVVIKRHCSSEQRVIGP